jgi:hypothetical protein
MSVYVRGMEELSLTHFARKGSFSSVYSEMIIEDESLSELFVTHFA